MSTEVQISTTTNIRIWWNITWKTMVFGMPAGFVGGMFGAMIGSIIAENNHELINQIGSICSYLAVIPVAILVVGHAINTNYGKYRLSLIEIDNSTEKTEEVIEVSSEQKVI
jgi:ABC-type lipoprotein release transport system permease subunit